MGTRHLIAVQLNEEYKVAQYGQWDGYPEGQGLDVLDFLSSWLLPFFEEKLHRVRFLDEEVMDKEFVVSYNKNAPIWSSDQDNRTHSQRRWFENYISRDLGSDILRNIATSDDKEILLKNSIDFAGNSLFCEWGYVIDFDSRTFEIYEGYNKSPLSDSDRFFNIERDRNSCYHQIALVKKYDLLNLPTKGMFLSDLIKQDDVCS